MNVVDFSNALEVEAKVAHPHEERLNVTDHLHVDHHHLVGEDPDLEKGIDADEHLLDIDPDHLVVEGIMMTREEVMVEGIIARMVMIRSRIVQMR